MEKIDHQLTSNVKLLHKVVLLSDGHVLLLKRSNQAQSRPGKWDLPGGNSEWPTDKVNFVRSLHQQDVSREIKEETAISVESDSFDQTNLIYFDTTYEPQKEMFTVLCGWRHNLPTQQKVTISDEHQDHEWVPVEKIEDYDFGFAQFIPQMIVNAIS